MEQKIARRSGDVDLASLSDNWKTLHVNPAVNGYLFRIREKLGSGRRWMGSATHLPCPNNRRL